jgi:hypothetical protein
MTSSPAGKPDSHGRYHLLIVGAGPADWLRRKPPSAGRKSCADRAQSAGGHLSEHGCIPSKTIHSHLAACTGTCATRSCSAGRCRAGSPWIFRQSWSACDACARA